MRSDRTREGMAASVVGIVCNLLLCAGKIAVGLLFGLVSVAADGVNNLSDCGSGVVSLISFRVAEKPADREHPYGHRRAESIAAMMMGCFILLAAAELIRASVGSILHAETSPAGWPVFLVLSVSILVKTGMFLFYRVKAKRLASDTLKAAALDSLVDCISTISVILGAVLGFFGVRADGYIAGMVALFIVWQGIALLRETASTLLGRAPEPAVTERVKAMIRSTDGVLGFHDLYIFSYGKGVSYATVHVEMDASLPALQSHAILDELEQAVAQETGILLTTHLDPIDLTDERAALLKQQVASAAQALAQGEVHDFRLIRGAEEKVIFEVTVPFSCPLSDGEISASLTETVLRLGDFRPVITVDRA